jgi:hypothetical protein
MSRKQAHHLFLVCPVYYSAGMLFFLTHFLKKVMCLFTYDLTILRKIDIGCIVVIEIDVILKLLTWARKYNILFHYYCFKTRTSSDMEIVLETSTHVIENPFSCSHYIVLRYAVSGFPIIPVVF